MDNIEAIPTYRAKGTRIPGLLDGAKYLHEKLRNKKPGASLESSEQNIKLLLS